MPSATTMSQALRPLPCVPPTTWPLMPASYPHSSSPPRRRPPRNASSNRSPRWPPPAYLRKASACPPYAISPDCYAPVRPPSPVPTMPSPGPAYCAPAGAPEHSYCGSRARIDTMPATCWPKPRPPRRTDRLSTCPRARRTFRCCRTSARFSASSARTRHSSIHTTGRPSCPCWNRFCDATGRMSRRR